MKSLSNLPPESRQKVCSALQGSLAGAIHLHQSLTVAHWCVRGPRFVQLHELYESLAKDAYKRMDKLAERCAALGGRPFLTPAEVAARSVLPQLVDRGDDLVGALLPLLQAHAECLRGSLGVAKEVGDEVTENLLVDMLGSVETTGWFFHSMLA